MLSRCSLFDLINQGLIVTDILVDLVEIRHHAQVLASRLRRLLHLGLRDTLIQGEGAAHRLRRKLLGTCEKLSSIQETSTKKSRVRGLTLTYRRKTAGR